MKLRYAAIVLPLLIGSSVSFAAPAANAPAYQSNMKHQAMPNQPKLCIGHVYKLARKAGYNHIWKIEYEHNYYEVKGYDAQGNKVKLKIDPTTGAINKSKSIF